jgi:hypothetical protein
MLSWDEPKRKLNLKNHGLDFVGCDAIWDHFTVTREDKRQDYGEERWVCFALMASPNSPTRGHPKFPQAAPSDYDASAWMTKRAAASLSL